MPDADPFGNAMAATGMLNDRTSHGYSPPDSTAISARERRR